MRKIDSYDRVLPSFRQLRILQSAALYTAVLCIPQISQRLNNGHDATELFNKWSCAFSRLSLDDTHRRRRKFKARVIRTRVRAPDFTITTDQQEFYRIPTVLMYISVSLSLSLFRSFLRGIHPPPRSALFRYIRSRSLYDTRKIVARLNDSAKSVYWQKLYIKKIKNFFDEKYLTI